MTAEQVTKWQQELLRAISEELSALPDATARQHQTGEVTVTLDAPSYDFWYLQGFAAFHYSATGDSSLSPVVKWANGFRSEIVAAAKNAK